MTVVDGRISGQALALRLMGEGKTVKVISEECALMPREVTGHGSPNRTGTRGPATSGYPGPDLHRQGISEGFNPRVGRSGVKNA